MASKACPECNSLNNPTFPRCWKCKYVFDQEALNMAKAPTRKKEKSVWSAGMKYNKAMIFFGLGLLLYIVDMILTPALYFRGSDAYTLGARILVFLMSPLGIAAFLFAGIPCVLVALGSKRCLKAMFAFSIVFFSAALVKVGVSSFNVFVVLPQVRQLVLEKPELFEGKKPSSDTRPIEQNTANEIFTSSEHGFSIAFPDGWTMKKSSSPDTIIKSVFRDASNRLAIISIAAYKVDKGIDLKNTTGPEMFESLRDTYPDAKFSLEDYGNQMINGKYVLWTKVRFIEPAYAKSLTKHYHFVSNGYLYRLSTMTDLNEEWFAEIEPTMEKSIKTFKFTNSASHPE